LTGLGTTLKLSLVDNSAKKPIIGILGGIASGKTAVAREFGKLGCAVIDADRIAHELLDEPSVKQSIIKEFGDGILDPAGRISRKKLADIAFADKDKISVLNNILHPPVLRQIEVLIERFNGQTNIKAIVLDMPLLMEIGWHKRCDRLIFVDCDPDLRAKRAKKMCLCSENQLKIRENFQISLDSKASIADNVVYNNSSFSDLVRQVADIFSYIN